jgi:hypothetical protein
VVEIDERLVMALKTLCRHLNDNELFYVFEGELSSRMLGCAEEVRTLDLLMNITDEEKDRLMVFLGKEGFSHESRWRGPLNYRHGDTGMELRIRMAGAPGEMASIGRRRPANLGYLSFFILSAEDLVLGSIQKGGGDEETAVRVYRKWMNHLDMEYMVVSARERGVYKRFIALKLKSGD